MVASMSDKLKSTWNSASPAPTVTTGTRSAGAGTLACQSLNWPTDTAVDFATFAKNTDGSVNQASVQEFTGIVSGNNLNSIVLTSGGSDQGNNIGDIVVMKPTSKGHQDLVDAVKTVLNQDGTLKNNVVTTTKINDGSVTNSKIDFTSFSKSSITFGSPYNTNSWGFLFKIGDLVFLNIHWEKNSGNFTSAETYDITIPAGFRLLYASPTFTQIVGIRSDSVLGRVMITGNSGTPVTSFRLINGAGTAHNYLDFQGVYSLVKS